MFLLLEFLSELDDLST